MEFDHSVEETVGVDIGAVDTAKISDIDVENIGGAAVVTPAPPPRYASIQVFKDDGYGQRGGELTHGSQIWAKEWLQAEISIREKPIGLRPKTEPRPIREPKQSGPVAIIVTVDADSSQFSINERVRQIVLPPKGDSVEQAIFRIQPLRSSPPDEPFKIRFRLFYKFNLIEKLILTSRVIQPHGEEEEPSIRSNCGLELGYGKLRQNDANDFDEMSPCVMHIDVVPHRGQYELTFSTARTGFDELAFTAAALLSDAQLASAMSSARKALFEVCFSETLGKQIDGDPLEYPDQLKRLADEGRQLWTLLFDRGPDQSITVIGKWLKDNPLPYGSKIQVSTESTDAKFVFAWNLLFEDTGIDPEKSTYPTGFWGLRYVIEQRIMLVLPPMSESPNVEIAAMYWKFTQTPALAGSTWSD